MICFVFSKSGLQVKTSCFECEGNNSMTIHTQHITMTRIAIFSPNINELFLSLPSACGQARTKIGGRFVLHLSSNCVSGAFLSLLEVKFLTNFLTIFFDNFFIYF